MQFLFHPNRLQRIYTKILKAKTLSNSTLSLSGSSDPLTWDELQEAGEANL